MLNQLLNVKNTAEPVLQAVVHFDAQLVRSDSIVYAEEAGLLTPTEKYRWYGTSYEAQQVMGSAACRLIVSY